MPQHLMNHEEFRTNYPGEKQMYKAIADQIRDQESGVYTERYFKGSGIPEMKAEEQCLAH